MALNHGRDNGKPQCKLSYKILRDEYGSDSFLDISPYSTLIQLKHFPGRIHHCDTVVGKSIFDGNFPFAVPLTKDNLYYCFINYDETKVMNYYKLVLKSISFTRKRIIKVSFKSGHS